MKKCFFKLGKDEIPNCKPNLVEIFFRGEKISAQTQGMKNEIYIFGTFSKLWREIENISLPKKKNFNRNIF